jgi:hypothetical protein
VDAVKQEIADAFSLPIPEAKQLIGPSRGDAAEERRIADDLAGKEWSSLNAAFLNERWASFCYLSAEGYRYYLPALLWNCLNDFVSENQLLHSAVYSLQPSYWSLYYRGGDESFRYQTSLFNAGQLAAVASFLGLVFDTMPHLQFLSAQALRWGWSNQVHPALDKVRDFYYLMSHYQRPTAKTPEAEEIIAQITTAFDATRYPGDHELCGSEMGDEPAEYAMEFRGLDWRTIHPDFLSHHYASLSFFSNPAFRYFLPAYLIADLMGTDTSATPVFHLTRGVDGVDESAQMRQWAQSGELSDEVSALLLEQSNSAKKFDWYQIAVEKFSHFTALEREAIVAFLRYSRSDEFARESIDNALERYWLQAS